MRVAMASGGAVSFNDILAMPMDRFEAVCTAIYKVNRANAAPDAEDATGANVDAEMARQIRSIERNPLIRKAVL